MNNFNPIRYVSAIALIGLAACSTNYKAMQGESDNLYFMASDARIATEFAVKNNNPDNFREIEEIRSIDVDQDNFSARNVNPEYIAKYQRSTEPVEEGSVYFDDADSQAMAPQEGDIDAYDNFRGRNGNFSNPMVFNNFMFSPMMGMGGMWGPMGFYDPFWGPGMGMWGPGFMRPGFGMRMGFGMGFGWGSPFMRPGFGFYDPFWDPWMMGFGPRWGMGMGMWGGGMWGRGFYNPVIIVPGGEIGRRQLVSSARPSRSSSLATATPRSRSEATQPGSSRAAARRDAVASSPNARNRAASTRNDFSRSQNDYYNTASAAPAGRNINSPAMNRAGNTATRSAYTTPSRTATTPRTQAPANINTRRSNVGSTRSGYSAPSRNTSPSYNRTRSTAPSYNQRSTAPSRSTYSPPSRSSSPSFSAPSRGGYSGGGASRGGGSVGGGRRGN
ncbi:hypothetical protein [Negadavirga shengliensis]|uniref:Uncharacterized protein n=1 Tax=Negadavirga shengliensis TaxID=1389218 RepID=A0ABV9T4M4_9BACT